MFGIAVWGLGRHAFKNVLPAISMSADFELVGVCSRSEGKRDDAVGLWGGRSWEDPGEMLDTAAVDAVYVATPTGFHFAHGMQVLEARRHLVCEKSLTANPVQSLELVERAAHNELVLCEALMFGYHPRFLALRSVVQRADFGRPLHASCTFGLPPLENPGFRTHKALGGGALLDLGCYPIAAMRMLFGEVESVLHARIQRLHEDEVDSGGDASLSFAGGARADVSWGYNRAYAADLHVWGERQSAYANHVFLKETGSDSSILLSDRFGKCANVPAPAGDAFVHMLGVVRSAITDSSERGKLLAEAAGQARALEAVLRAAEYNILPGGV